MPVQIQTNAMLNLSAAGGLLSGPPMLSALHFPAHGAAL